MFGIEGKQKSSVVEGVSGICRQRILVGPSRLKLPQLRGQNKGNNKIGSRQGVDT